MSALAALYNVPGTPEELSTWGAAHQSHHRDIARVIYEILGVQMTEFILDPFDIEDSGVWQYQHQIMHQEMDAVLGINGFALTNVDLSNQDALTGWIFANASEHYQAANTLGIG